MKLISSYASTMSSATSSHPALPPALPPNALSLSIHPQCSLATAHLAGTFLIYDANDPDKVLGGPVLKNGVTNADMYSMGEIMIIFGGGFSQHEEGCTKIERDDCSLQPGNSFIDADSRLISTLFMITWLIDISA